MSKTFSLPFFLSCLATTVAAQTPLAPFAPPLTVRAWPDKANYPGDFGAMVRASITKFGYPDAVFQVGGKIMIMKAPALLNQIEPLAGTVGFETMDLCAIDGSPLGYPLAMTGSSGLGLWSKHSQTLTLMQNANWAGATSLHHVRGHDAVVAINATGNRIVLADIRTATELPQWGVQGLLAVATFDYNADGLDEVAVIRTHSIEVRNLDGTILTSFAAALSEAEAARSPTPVGDALSIACKVPGLSQQYLTSIHQIWQGFSPLGTTNSVGLTVADGDDDGWHDVMLMSTTAPTMDSLLCLGATQVPWFEYGPSTGFEVSLPAGTSTVTNPASPLMMDYNGDGRTDSILALQDDAAFALGESPFSPGAIAEVTFGQITLVTEEGAAGAPDTANLQLDVQHTNLPEGATHIEMHVYVWDVVAAGEPLYRSAWGSTTTWPSEEAPPAIIASGSFPAQEIAEKALIFVLRYTKQEAGVTTQIWPPHTGSATRSNGVQAHLGALPGFSVTGFLWDGGSTSGGVTVITQMPPVKPATGFDADGV